MMKKPTFLQRFLWIFATSDPKVLAECEEYSEKTRHALIGTFILITGLFAWASGAFLFSFILDAGSQAAIAWKAALFGLLWAFLIVSIDRLLISTIGKEKVRSKLPIKSEAAKAGRSKGASAIFLLIRLGVAVLISFFITKPLELWLYSAQIEVEAMESSAERLEEHEQNLFKSSDIDLFRDLQGEDSVKLARALQQYNLAVLIEKYNDTKEKNQKYIANTRRKIRNIERKKVAKYVEIDSTQSPPKERLTIQGLQEIDRMKRRITMAQNTTKEMYRKSQNAGAAPKDYDTLKVASAQAQVEALKSNLTELDNDLRAEKERIAADKDDAKNALVKANEDLFGQLDNLHRYVYNPDEPSRKYVSWLILLIFIFIETLPIITKTISPPGEYEQKIADRKYQRLVRSKLDREETEKRLRAREDRQSEQIAELQGKLNLLEQKQYRLEEFLEEVEEMRV